MAVTLKKWHEMDGRERQALSEVRVAREWVARNDLNGLQMLAEIKFKGGLSK